MSLDVPGVRVYCVYSRMTGVENTEEILRYIHMENFKEVGFLQRAGYVSTRDRTIRHPVSSGPSFTSTRSHPGVYYDDSCS